MNKTCRRMLGAMLVLANDQMEVTATLTEISNAAGYKATGGIQTYALQTLEHNNLLLKEGENKWLVTL